MEGVGCGGGGGMYSLCMEMVSAARLAAITRFFPGQLHGPYVLTLDNDHRS